MMIMLLGIMIILMKVINGSYDNAITQGSDMSELGDMIIRGLERLLEDIQSDVPIEATEIERIETPEGPIFVRKKVNLNERRITDDFERDLS